MSVWDRLGIAPTNDIKAIKSAYAAKAKEFHPEEHPEEFQELQSAYKAAVQYAKFNIKGYEYNTAVKVENNETVKKEQTEKVKEESEEKIKKPVKENEKVIEKSEEEIKRTFKDTESDRKKGFERAKENNRDNSKTEEEFKYYYDEINEENIREEFWVDFLNIAKNPFVINNLLVWEVFLSNRKWKILLNKPEFQDSLIRNICAVHGFTKETILFFDNYVQDTKRATSLWWRYRKIAFYKEKICTANKCYTNQQREFHDNIVNRLNREGIDCSLTTIVSVKAYLKIYLEYGKKHIERIHFFYEQRIQKAGMFKSFIFAGIMCVVFFAGLRYSMHNMPENNRQQRYQEEYMDSLKDQLDREQPTPYVLKKPVIPEYTAK